MHEKIKLGLIVLVGVAVGGVGMYVFQMRSISKPMQVQKSVQTSGQETVSLSVDGMDCEACAVKIESSLKEMAGVENCSVTFSEKKLVCRINPQLVSVQDLIKGVKAVGFEAVEKVDSGQLKVIDYKIKFN